MGEAYSTEKDKESRYRNAESEREHYMITHESTSKTVFEADSECYIKPLLVQHQLREY